MDLVVLLALIVGFVAGRYRAYRAYVSTVFQYRGEALVSEALLANFDTPNHHLMNHITLPLEDGTTQIDHILISRFGVFVIETKDYKGWIFGSATQRNWTQVLFRRKHRFQNPIRQNFRHVRAVETLLDFLPPGVVRSIVVFVGEAEFKTDIPQGVFDLPGLVEFLEKQTQEVLSLNRMQFCVGRIEATRLAISGHTDFEHAQNLDRKYGGAS